MFKTLLFVGLALTVPDLAEARTVTVAGIVTKSTGLVQHPDSTVVADYPLIGSIGTLTYTIGKNDLGEVDPTTSFWPSMAFEPQPVTATANVGSFSGGIIPTAANGETEMETVFTSTGQTRFSTRTVGLGVTGETYAGSLRFTFSPALAAAPTTWSDLFAAIDSGDALASLSWNGTLEGNFIEFEMTQVEPAPIPLPGSAPLLMAGAAGLALLRRRSRDAAL
jgi:hypothetical protein